jgi:uncharacterized membrane-anchored protein YhcB (DUF1043 family)
MAISVMPMAARLSARQVQKRSVQQVKKGLTKQRSHVDGQEDEVSKHEHIREERVHCVNHERHKRQKHYLRNEKANASKHPQKENDKKTTN